MCVVGAITATRPTRPSSSIRCATRRPKVVLPAAGVAEARNELPSWLKTASSASCCQARSGRAVGQDGSARERAGRGAVSGWYVIGRSRLGGAADGTGLANVG